MEPSLYLFSGAPRSWRVLLGLAFKGIEADVIIMDYSEREHHKPEFKAINPRLTVPVLRHGDTILRDSIAILAWLDHAYPQKRIFGDTAASAGEIWQVSMECADYLRAAIDQLLSVVFASDGSIPAKGSKTEQDLNLGAKLAHAECRYLENLLSDGRSFLCGERPTAADAIAFPEIRLIQRAVETKHDLMASVGFGNPSELYPKTAAWKNRLNATPEVAATLPPHWTESSNAA